MTGIERELCTRFDGTMGLLCLHVSIPAVGQYMECDVGDQHSH